MSIILALCGCANDAATSKQNKTTATTKSLKISYMAKIAPHATIHERRLFVKAILASEPLDRDLPSLLKRSVFHIDEYSIHSVLPEILYIVAKEPEVENNWRAYAKVENFEMDFLRPYPSYYFEAAESEFPDVFFAGCPDWDSIERWALNNCGRKFGYGSFCPSGKND